MCPLGKAWDSATMLFRYLYFHGYIQDVKLKENTIKHRYKCSLNVLVLDFHYFHERMHFLTD